MDIGTVQCAKEGKLQVTRKQIAGLYENGVVYQDGTKEEFDGIVWAIGYKMFDAHKRLFDEKLFKKIGSGPDALQAKQILPGSEHPDVPNLFFLFGRLQMIRDGAPGLGKRVLAKTPNKKDLHPKDFSETWSWFAIKHIIAGYAFYQYRKRSKL